MAPVEPAYLTLSLRLCCVGVAVESCEVLWNWDQLKAPGLIGWRPYQTAGGPLRRLIRTAYGYPSSVWWLCLRLAGALFAVTLPFENVWCFWAIAWLVVAQIYYNRRFMMLAGNSDTMFLICLFGLLAAAVPGASSYLRLAGVAFIAFQISLAYLVAGLDKLTSPAWRSGLQMRQVLTASSYRIPTAVQRIGESRLATWALAWTVMGLQTALAICVLLPDSGFWFVLAAGLLFHGAIAILMGLHGFWWSFVSGYPVLCAAHQWLRSS